MVVTRGGSFSEACGPVAVKCVGGGFAVDLRLESGMFDGLGRGMLVAIGRVLQRERCSERESDWRCSG
jgi:hypothetical protein